MLINGKEFNINPGADLRSANLYNANLRGADLRDVNLRGANLNYADLCGADLSCADLRSANLNYADLRGANLRGANNIPLLTAAQLNICAEGDIIGYKKLNSGKICKILIPQDAKRSNATTRKCRAEYAIVLEGEGVSQHDSNFTYKVGETIRPTEPFCEDRWQECASGIHFFLTREEAENYT